MKQEKPKSVERTVTTSRIDYGSGVADHPPYVPVPEGEGWQLEGLTTLAETTVLWAWKRG